MVDKLISGFVHFKEEFFVNDTSFFEQLVAKGQAPETMVISCSDSRVDPALLFNTRPGDIFIARNVANLVPPYAPDDGLHGVGAAIEYAVMDLKVRNIVILGHAHCGGITALCKHCYGEQLPERHFIGPWIKIAEPAITEAKHVSTAAEAQHIVEHAAIKNSLQNLQHYPFIAERLQKNKISLHGWWFDMDEGSLFAYDQENDHFNALTTS